MCRSHAIRCQPLKLFALVYYTLDRFASVSEYLGDLRFTTVCEAGGHRLTVAFTMAPGQRLTKFFCGKCVFYHSRALREGAIAPSDTNGTDGVRTYLAI